MDMRRRKSLAHPGKGGWATPVTSWLRGPEEDKLQEREAKIQTAWHCLAGSPLAQDDSQALPMCVQLGFCGKAGSGGYVLCTGALDPYAQ